ncbi:myb-like protein I [Nasonia vitripennis]|uniref:RRM domain-containing protein n=1 Tax=Nasonia vitripennis TaxID=7425 RepID=A0A7M7Q2D3_NASVI|nr:myb-like protein I [Nasonia vitripennis]
MSFIADNGPMWSKGDDGTYWLLFPNKHALTKEEIREIFSQYGQVLNLTMAGDEKGFRFVQYATLEDVERAVENLQDHPTIKLVPHRPKKKNNKSCNGSQRDRQNNNNVINQDTSMDSVKRNLYQRKSPKNNNEQTDSNKQQFQNAMMFSRESMHKQKNSDTWPNNDKASVQLTPSSKSFCNKSNFIPQTPKNTMNSQVSRSNSADSLSPPNLVDQKNRTQHLLKLRGANANSFSINESYNNSNTDDDEIPELVTKTQLDVFKQPRKVILNAEEVIVANVHTDYGSAYVLHLFEQYEPLAVSYMKVLPNSEVRYCHVYFKSAQDSLEVETVFDKYDLSGKNLIVLRPCRLMAEAMS